MDDTELIAKWRTSAGQRIEARRSSLYRSRRKAAEASDVSESVWRQIESGARQLAPGVEAVVNPTMSTKAAVCRALGWTPDSIDRILRGEEPQVDWGSPVLHQLQTQSDEALLEEARQMRLAAARSQGDPVSVSTPDLAAEIAKLIAEVQGLRADVTELKKKAK